MLDDNLLKVPAEFSPNAVSSLCFSRDAGNPAVNLSDEMLQASITKVFQQYKLSEAPKSTPLAKGFLVVAVDQVGPSYHISMNYVRNMTNWDKKEYPVSVWFRTNLAIDFESTKESILKEVENQISLFCAAYIHANQKIKAAP
jgi:hypothetical protein